MIIFSEDILQIFNNWLKNKLQKKIILENYQIKIKITDKICKKKNKLLKILKILLQLIIKIWVLPIQLIIKQIKKSNN